MAGGGRITRIHGPFVSDEEVEHVVTFLKSQGTPEYLEEVTEEIPGAKNAPSGLGPSSGDELYDEAVALIAREGKASTSFIQRHLQIGYNRAARIIERMENEGVVSKASRVGRREVLIGEVSETVL
jgi:S-DNA-T family DNA segregation ATPase FtsK/SpoIIIE